MTASPERVIHDAKASAAKAAAEFRGLIESKRTELLRLKQRLDRMEAGPPTREEALADLDACLDKLAMRPRDLGAHHLLSQQLTRQGPFYDSLYYANPMRLLMTVCKAQVRDVMVSALDAEVKSIGGYASIGPEQRRRDAEQLRAELLDLEVAEEGLIRDAEAFGLMVERRVDADARAVLGLDDAA